MAELTRIAARLESLEELGELVGALRSMAASRAREAQEAFKGTRAYCRIVERAIADLDGMTPDRQDREGERLLMVIASENGFVGGFNNRLIDRAIQLRTDGETFVIVGRRGQTCALERGVTADLTFAMTSRTGGVTQLARRIAARLADVAQARIVFAAYRSGAAFDVEVRQVLPLAPAEQADAAALPPLHHLPTDLLMDRLASEYLFAELAHALMESLASENGARLQTMDAASHNIEDRLDKLRREERAARQEQTTSDMLDVVVGSEAVNHH